MATNQPRFSKAHVNIKLRISLWCHIAVISTLQWFYKPPPPLHHLKWNLWSAFYCIIPTLSSNQWLESRGTPTYLLDLLCWSASSMLSNAKGLFAAHLLLRLYSPGILFSPFVYKYVQIRWRSIYAYIDIWSIVCWGGTRNFFRTLSKA